MNTPEERREAAKAIAKMRPEPTRKRLPRNSRALEIDHYRDAQELKHLEDGEEIEVPSYKLSEPNKINYSQQSIYGARTGKQNSPWQQGCYLNKTSV